MFSINDSGAISRSNNFWNKNHWLFGNWCSVNMCSEINWPLSIAVCQVSSTSSILPMYLWMIRIQNHLWYCINAQILLQLSLRLLKLLSSKCLKIFSPRYGILKQISSNKEKLSISSGSIILFWNLSIYNVICWFAGPMGQMTRQTSVWCSKY